MVVGGVVVVGADVVVVELGVVDAGVVVVIGGAIVVSFDCIYIVKYLIKIRLKAKKSYITYEIKEKNMFKKL